MRLHDLMEPEETVGKLWHDLASEMGAAVAYPNAAVSLESLRPSLAALFRALGGSADIEICEATATLVTHRRTLKRKIGAERDKEWRASFDGERLRLPPVIATFSETELNRGCYFWLVALAACASHPASTSLPFASDCAQIGANTDGSKLVHAACPGLRGTYNRMCAVALATRPVLSMRADEAVIEQAVGDQLRGQLLDLNKLPKDISAWCEYQPFAPVPFWLHFAEAGSGALASPTDDATAPPGAAATLPASLACARTAMRPTGRTASSCTVSSRFCRG